MIDIPNMIKSIDKEGKVSVNICLTKYLRG